MGGMRYTGDLISGGPLWRGRGWLAPNAAMAAAVPSVWPQMRQVILGALAPFPEARAAIAAAIREFATSEDET